jgi:putative heme iron utilization protein
MIGIDPDGFDVRCVDAGAERVLRFDFAAPVTNSLQARQALVALAQAARS